MNKIYQTRLNIGIRQKVLMVLLTVLLIALSLSGWFALKQEQKSLAHEIDRRGSDIARFVAKSLSYSIVGYDYHTIELLLKEIIRSEEIHYARVVNKREKEMGMAGLLNEENQSSTKLFTEKILLEDEVIGELTLGLSTKKINERMESNKFSLIAREALIILMIAIGEFIALSFIIIKPVRTISQSLDNVVDKDGQIVANIPLRSGDEFGQLANKFNELGADLNTANKKLQSKIESADSRLQDTNTQLMKQQEELKSINEELRQMSITDALTGLYNRRHFEDLISEELNISLRHGDDNSLILIDIDFFKKINDKFGHFSGDIVLKVVADVLKESVRKTDVLCRIGGEEFAVLCKRANKKSVEIVAEKLRLNIEKRDISLGEKTINVTISLGAATIPDVKNTNSVDAFYRYADTALYSSKETGRNKFTHFEDMSEN